MARPEGEPLAPTSRFSLLTIVVVGLLITSVLVILATVAFVVAGMRPLQPVDIDTGLPHQFPDELPRHERVQTEDPNVTNASEQPPQRAETLGLDLSLPYEADDMTVRPGPAGMVILEQLRQNALVSEVPLRLLKGDGTPLVGDVSRVQISGQVLLPEVTDALRSTEGIVACNSTDTSEYYVLFSARSVMVNVYEPGESRWDRRLAGIIGLPHPGPGWHDFDVICNGELAGGTRVRVWVDDQLVIDEYDRASELRPWRGQLGLAVYSDEFVQRPVAFRELTVRRPR